MFLDANRLPVFCHRVLFLVVWVVVLTCALSGTDRIWACQPPERYGDIPSDSIAVVSIDLKALRDNPIAQALPWEIADVACEEQVGFSLRSVVSIDLTVGMPSPLPEVGLSIRFDDSVDIAKLKDSLAGPVEGSPKDSALRYRSLIEAPLVRVAQKEDRRVLVGTEGTLRRMLSQRIQTGGPTVQLVKASDAPARMVLNFAKIRDLASAAYEQAAPTIPESMHEDIEGMIRLIENIFVEVRPMSDQALRVSMGTASGPNADSLLGCMNHLRSEAGRIADEGMREQLDQDENLSDAMRTAIYGYSDRIQGLLETQEFWSVNDDRVHWKIENSMAANYATIGVLTGLLLPAVQAAREAARRVSSSNNLKQIMLSLWNYESAYKKLPGRMTKSKDGKPLLSWRVMILPFLEENNLYNEFHLDEPWDSEHNLKLLDRMPAIYANPRVVTLPGHTVYLAPYGENTGWPEDSFKIAQITDGTSNTIAVVEASSEVAVPWTKPDDLEIEFFPDSSWMPPGVGANVAFFDGSVRFLDSFIDPTVLQGLFTMNGGEAVTLP
jgi:prepilin-type processing-associated H-X9-DG protein